MSSLVPMSALSKRKDSAEFPTLVYLPEEPPLRISGSHPSGVSNGATWNGSARPLSADGDGARAAQALIRATPEPWRTLYQLEARVTQGLRIEKGKGAIAEFAKDLVHWLNAEVTPEGFLKSAGPQTPAAIPILLRLRRVLGKHWRKRHQRALDAIFRRSCQLAVANGWLLGPDQLSKRWHLMLKESTREGDLGRWPKILSRVQRSKRMGKSHAPARPLGICCDEAGLAIFQTGGGRSDARLALDFSMPDSPVDLRVGAEPILRGRWSTSVRIDGAERTMPAAWQPTCWHADDDGQFLELRLQTEEFLIDRQIFLCRRAPVLFVVDALQVEAAARVELAWNLPCSEIGGWQGIVPTRAQRCVGLDHNVAILPIGMPVDPLAASPGSLAVEKGTLRAGVQQQGRVAVLPLAFVWGSPAKSALSWRALTITSDRRVVEPEEAVAWRITVANQPIVYFRSTLGTHRLAFLGHQTFYETVIGPLDKKGDLRHWLMVDATPGEPLPH